MMGRIFGNHKHIFTFNELHFFGTIWTNNSNQELNELEQINLLSRLFCIEANGLFRQESIADFNDKAKVLLSDKIMNPLEVYALFLNTITLEKNATQLNDGETLELIAISRASKTAKGERPKSVLDEKGKPLTKRARHDSKT